MEYEPLSEVRENLKVQWYRSRLAPARFRELSKRSDRQGWMQAGGHFGLFCLTGAAVYLTWAQGLWIAFLVALFAHGTVASFFSGTAVHELGHGTVFKTKWLNGFFLYLFSLISWWNPFDYAASHTYHHRYTLHPEGDREVLLPLHPNVGRTFLLQLFTVNLLTQPGRTFSKGGILSAIWVTILDAFGKVGSTEIPANEWRQALHDDQPDQHRRSRWWSRTQLAFHGAVLVVSIPTGLWVVPLIITIPSFIGDLAQLLRRPPPALRADGAHDRLPQEHAVDAPAQVRGIPLLAHELAHRASHVCRHPLLQSSRAGSRDQGRHARTAQSAWSLARDARHMGAPEVRSGLHLRHAPAGHGADREAREGGGRRILDR